MAQIQSPPEPGSGPPAFRPPAVVPAENILHHYRKESAYLQTLLERIDDVGLRAYTANKLAWYTGRAKSNKWRYFTFTFFASSLPFVVSVISLLGSPPDVCDILAAILSAIAGILTSWAAIWKLRENWIRYRKSATRIIEETEQYLDAVDPYAVYGSVDDSPTARKKRYVKRISEIVMKENEEWAEDVQDA